MFSKTHIVLIILTLISVPLISRYLSSKGYKTVDKVLKIIAVVILFFDPAYWVWEYLTFGKFHFESTLPFYLCSLFWILMPFSVFSKNKNVRQIAQSNIATVGLISGVLGFVLNYHIDVYPMISFVSIRTLSYHYLMILTASLFWISGYYQPQDKDSIRAFIPVLILLIPGLILNALYGYDYGYTNGGQGTAFTLLSDHLPKPLFLVVLYSIFYLIIKFIFYRKNS